jgi:protein ImuB
LLTLVRLDLERKQPGAPVVGFTFKAHPDRPRAAQLTLFGPAVLSPDRMATSLARLFTLLGPEGIGCGKPIDSHVPSRFEILQFEPPDPPIVRPESPRSKGLLAIRNLRPPVPLVVRKTAGKLLAVQSRAATASASSESTTTSTSYADRHHPRFGGRIRVASGPWAVEENWWSERQAINRYYWDVELENGGIYRIFRDQLTGEWFADGIYD